VRLYDTSFYPQKMNEKTEKVLSTLKNGLGKSEEREDVKLVDIVKKLTDKRKSAEKAD